MYYMTQEQIKDRMISELKDLRKSEARAARSLVVLASIVSFGVGVALAIVLFV